MIYALHPFFAILLALIAYVVGSTFLYFIIRHAVRTGVAEAMREILEEFGFSKAREKKE